MLQFFVCFQLLLHLQKKFPRNRFRVAEDADRNFWIFDDLLSKPGESNDRAFIVFARPQIQLAIRVRFNLSTARIQPRMNRIHPM